MKFRTFPPDPDPDSIEASLDAGNEEIVVDKNGLLRQAGATFSDTEVREMKGKAERSLYYFYKYIVSAGRRQIMSPYLHGSMCNFLQKTPPYRKGEIIPRGHLKSSIASQALPMHIQIQPEAHNIYWPGLDGSEMRILLAGEKQDMMKGHMRFIQTQYESNKWIRAFWLEDGKIWDDPRRQAILWNAVEMILPRQSGQDSADPSMRITGVGGAITGAHPNVIIKDDLISLEAANSPIVMQTAYEWHLASRALLAPDEDRGLEFIIGTRWAVSDIYEQIMATDPSVAWMVRAIVEDGKPIWPEQKTMADVEKLRKDHGAQFYLLYMNSAADPELTDFHEKDFRYYTVEGDAFVLSEDNRDVLLHARLNPTEDDAQAPLPDTYGKPLTDQLYNELAERRIGWRFRS